MCGAAARNTAVRAAAEGRRCDLRLSVE